MGKMLKSAVDKLFRRRLHQKRKRSPATQLPQIIYANQNHLQSSNSNVDNMEDNIAVRECLLPDFDRVTSPYHS